jgi:RNAse (barnase) inhibitor barstar
MNTTLGQALESGGVHRCLALDESAVRQAATARGMRCVTIGLAGKRDKQAFLSAMAATLGFPAHFGHNWDAFYDCVTDLAEASAGGLLLLLRQASEFARTEPEEFGAAVDAMRDAVDYWSGQGKALVAVVELETALLAPELPEVSAR